MQHLDLKEGVLVDGGGSITIARGHGHDGPPGDVLPKVCRDAFLEVKVLPPLDFIIAKLRRFTEEDIEDALFVVRKHTMKAQEVEKSAEEAIRHSVKDTALFLFRGNVQLFLERMRRDKEGIDRRAST